MQTLIALPALQEAKAAGLDYEREKAKKTTGLQAERKDKKKRKKNEDPGFSDFAQAQHRQYERLTNALKPDMAAYGK
jgi:pre-mRNA-splicing factor SYF2